MSQCDMIMKYIEDTGSITPWEAMREFGCMRLAARISDLRRRGEPIEKTTIHDYNRYGKRIRYARYTMAKE